MSATQRKAFKQLSDDMAAVREAVADAAALGDQTRAFSQAADDILREAGLELLQPRAAPALSVKGTEAELANAFPKAHAAMANLTDSLYALGERCLNEGVDGPLEAAQALFKAVVKLRPGYRSVNALQEMCAKLAQAQGFIRAGNLDAAERLASQVEKHGNAILLSVAMARIDKADRDGDWLAARRVLQKAIDNSSSDHQKGVFKRRMTELEEHISASVSKGIIDLPGNLKLELIKIPAGRFLYGDNKTQAQTGEYWMGKTPVTEAQFAAFAKATKYKGDSNTDQRVAQARNHPMTCVNCADAEAFCRWLSEVSGLVARLPSEQEWEKAARGTDGRTYPWSEEAPSSRLCNSSGTGPGTTTPVGSYPAGNSPYGCEDMAGNVWEWTSSNEGSGRVLRGGSWSLIAFSARCAYRCDNFPGSRLNYFGFRVCASPI